MKYKSDAYVYRIASEVFLRIHPVPEIKWLIVVLYAAHEKTTNTDSVVCNVHSYYKLKKIVLKITFKNSYRYGFVK